MTSNNQPRQLKETIEHERDNLIHHFPQYAKQLTQFAQYAAEQVNEGVDKGGSINKELLKVTCSKLDQYPEMDKFSEEVREVIGGVRLKLFFKVLMESESEINKLESDKNISFLNDVQKRKRWQDLFLIRKYLLSIPRKNEAIVSNEKPNIVSKLQTLANGEKRWSGQKKFHRPTKAEMPDSAKVLIHLHKKSGFAAGKKFIKELFNADRPNDYRCQMACAYSLESNSKQEALDYLLDLATLWPNHELLIKNVIHYAKQLGFTEDIYG